MTRIIVTAGVIALAAAMTGCGGGGSTPSPVPNVAGGANGNSGAAVHAQPTTSPGGSSTTTSLPPGTVGVTVSIRIPARTVAARARATRLGSKRSPAFIQSQTNGVQATVTAGTTNLGPVTGSCTNVLCTIVIPVPLAVPSTAVLQLLQGSTPIGQATASFVAGQFTEGIANTIVAPFTFQPLIGYVVVGAADSNSSNFLEGYAVQSFGLTLYLLDAAQNDVGSETDGALDLSGNPMTAITLTPSNLSSYGGPASFTPAALSAASDISLGTSAYSYPSPVQGQPDLIPTGANNVTYVSLSQSNAYTGPTGAYSYNYTAHNFSVTGPGTAYWNGLTGEYGLPSLAASSTDTFTFSEAIAADSSNVTVTLDYASGGTDATSSCSTIVNEPLSGFSGGTLSVPVGTPWQASITYYASPANGKCSIEFNDGSNPYVDATVYVDNNGITIFSKKVHK